MARRAITMTELVETIYHWHAGQGLRTIVKSLGISRNTVRKYVRLAKQAGLRRGEPLPSRERLVDILYIPGPQPASSGPATSQLSPFHAQLEAWFKEKDMTAKQAWRLLREEHGLQVGYTTVKSYVRTHIRKIGKALTVRMETPPGHQAQVDFGYVGLMFDPQAGRRRKAWAFIMVLSHSRHRFVRFVFGQDSATWIDCHRRAFEFFGGVPETVVLDNLKAGVIKADIYDPTINRAYAECGEHYGFLIDPAKARMPRHKGKVERQVPVVRQQVLAGRKFADIHEANQRALIWCREEVGMTVHGTTHRKPYEVFQSVERSALKALPVEPFETPTWKECTVHPDHYFFFGKAFYSMPSRYLHRKVWVRGSSRTVKVFFEEKLVKTHLPAPYPGYRRTDESDLPPATVAYCMPEPSRLRHQAQHLGEHVSELVDTLLHQNTLRNLRKIQGILRLGERYGGRRLDGACARAMAFGNTRYQSIKRILDQGLENQLPLPTASPAALSQEGQGFLRPGSYYAMALHAGGRS